MRIVITGATGFLGHAIGARLSKGGHRLIVLSRSAEQARSMLKFPCEAYDWNPVAEPAPLAAFEGGVDAVIHLAGEPLDRHRWTREARQRIYDSRVLSTRNLGEAIGRVFEISDGRPGVVISASAIGYYGDRGDEVLTEDSREGSGFLSEVCSDWEREASQISGPRIVPMRMGLVLGRGGGALARMVPAFRLGMGAAFGSGKQWMSWIHLDDLVELFLHVLKHSMIEGPVNAVSPLPVTNEEFTRILAKSLRRPTLLRVPATALRLGLGDMAEMLLASERVLPVKARATGFQFRFDRLEQALADLFGKGPKLPSPS